MLELKIPVGTFVSWTPVPIHWVQHLEGLTPGHPGVVQGGGPKHVEVAWLDRDGEFKQLQGVYDPEDLRQVSEAEHRAAVEKTLNSDWTGLDADRIDIGPPS